jgi:hypothetical protein
VLGRGRKAKRPKVVIVGVLCSCDARYPGPSDSHGRADANHFDKEQRVRTRASAAVRMTHYQVAVGGTGQGLGKLTRSIESRGARDPSGRFLKLTHPAPVGDCLRSRARRSASCPALRSAGV